MSKIPSNLFPSSVFFKEDLKDELSNIVLKSTEYPEIFTFLF